MESVGKNKYFVTFISTLSFFCEFVASVGRETSRKLKCLRVDSGREYTSGEFKEFCKKNGIRHVLTVTGTPRHNGVALQPHYC